MKRESNADIKVRELFRNLQKQKARETEINTKLARRRLCRKEVDEVETTSGKGDQRLLYKINWDFGGNHSGGTEGMIKDNLGNVIVKKEEKAQKVHEQFQIALNGSHSLEKHNF